MSIVRKLHAIIDDKYIACYTESGNESIILKEDDEGSSCQSITLRTNGIQKALVLKVDLSNADLHPFLIKKEKENQKGTFKGLRKKVDYLIFCERKNPLLNKTDLYIIPIELKSTNLQNWQTQAKAGITFGKFILSFLHVRDGKSIEKDKFNLEYRCILFCSKTGTDTPTSYEKKGKLNRKDEKFFNPRKARKAKKESTNYAYTTHEEYLHQFCIRGCGETYSLSSFTC